MKRFEITKEYRRLTDSIVRIVRERGRGCEITHGEIHAVTGLDPNTERWGNFVRLMKARCRRELGIVVWCKKNHSFHALTLQEQLEIPSRARTRRARRQVRRAIREVQSTPDADLSVHQRAVKAQTIEALGTQSKQILRQARVIEAIKPSSAFGFHPTPSV